MRLAGVAARLPYAAPYGWLNSATENREHSITGGILCDIILKPLWPADTVRKYKPYRDKPSNNNGLAPANAQHSSHGQYQCGVTAAADGCNLLLNSRCLVTTMHRRRDQAEAVRRLNHWPGGKGINNYLETSKRLCAGVA